MGWQGGKPLLNQSRFKRLSRFEWLLLIQSQAVHLTCATGGASIGNIYQRFRISVIEITLEKSPDNMKLSHAAVSSESFVAEFRTDLTVLTTLDIPAPLVLTPVTA